MHPFTRYQSPATVHSLTRSILYEFAETFAYGKYLAKEALNKVFRQPGKKSWKASPDLSLVKALLSLFSECTNWSTTDWLLPTNWKRIHDTLSQIIFPVEFRRFRTFRLKGFRAGIFSTETLEYIKEASSVWKNKRRTPALIDNEVQNGVDLLEMMITENIVEASHRKECIQQLVQLCQKYHHIPKALELKGLSFKQDARNNIVDCGGSADIMLAELNGQKVVVKVLRADKAIRANMRKRKWSSLHEEALNWIGLDYPGLNPFLGITLNHPRANFGIGLVFKFQELGNSVKYLNNHDIDRVEFVQAKAFYLVGAIHYLHQMGLVHADIKGANILVDANENLVLTDFGLMLRTLLQSPSETPFSVTSSSATSTGSMGGSCSLRFSSRERVFKNVRSEKDDVWAIGMTLIELLTGKPPFTDVHKSDAWFVVALGHSQLDIQDAHLPESVPPELFQMIKRCISAKQEDRPDAFEIYTVMGQMAGMKALGSSMKEGHS